MNPEERRKQLLAEKIKVSRRRKSLGMDLPFLPIRLEALPLGWRWDIGLYLKIIDGHSETIKFKPYIEPGETLDATSIAPLQKIGVENLYFQEGDFGRLISYLNNYLTVLESERPDQIKTKLTVMSDHLRLNLHWALASSQPRLGHHLQLARQQVEGVFKEVHEHQAALSLIWEILFHQYDLFSHSINVCLLGLAILVFLKRSEQEGLTMGMAALFHDLGMTAVPPEIFYKSGGLTPEEWEQIKKHPLTGQRQLQSHSMMPVEGLQLVLEHHENADGSGYPQGLKLRQQHPFTRIMRVVDAYDALTNNSLYRPVRTPFSAIKNLEAQEGPNGKVFDRATLKAFVRFLALS